MNKVFVAQFDEKDMDLALKLKNAALEILNQDSSSISANQTVISHDASLKNTPILEKIRSAMSDIVREDPVIFDNEEKEIESPFKLVFDTFKIKEIGKFSSLINICELKIDAGGGYLGSVSGILNIMPGDVRSQYLLKTCMKQNIMAKMLVELYLAVCPMLNILIINYRQNKPNDSKAYIVMGNSGFAVDVAAASMIRVDPYSFATNDIYRKYVLKRNEITFEVFGEKKISIPGLNGIKIKNEPPIKAFFKAQIRNLLLSRPFIDKGKCTKSLNCVRVCPDTALSHDYFDDSIKCNLERCVRCFNCVKICPEKVIFQKQPVIKFNFDIKHGRKL